MKTCRNYLLILLIPLFLLSSPLLSQESIQPTDTVTGNKTSLVKATGITAGYYAASMLVLSQTWYKGRDRVDFHFYNDNQGYLQVDKFGHMYGSYVYSYLGYHYLRHAGFSRSEALGYGGTLGLVLQTPIEIMDGIYEGYGFSWGDMIANSLGSALVIGNELVFREQVVRYKFSYRDAGYAKNANGYLGDKPLDRIFKDYNSHTYWLSVPVDRLIRDERIPSWLSVAIGYSGNGMLGEFVNIESYNGIMLPEVNRYRQFFLAPDIDLARIPVKSPFIRTLLHGLNFIRLPLPALEYNTEGRLIWHWWH